MIIDDKDLDAFASDIVGKCVSTRKDRIPAYSGLKHYFLFGAQEGQQAPYGKIGPHIDLLTAFLYSQSTVEFDVAVQNQPEDVIEKSALIGKRLNTYFHDHGVADKFTEALTWALVFNSTFIKLNWQKGKGLKPYLVEPHNFGVLREDVTDLNDQEAFVHCYTISRSELRRRISMLPNAADIMRRIVAAPQVQQDAFPDAVNRMIISGTVNMTNSTTRGLANMPSLMGQMQYQPRSLEDVVEMYELWVWDDDNDDYRTITLAAPGVVIYGRQNIGNTLGIKGEHPFIHLCPNRLYDYFYGWSEITGLIKLQDWATQRLREIRDILAKQAAPPKALSGWGGITDEKIAALDLPNSWISDPTPNAKVEMLAPELPDDIWQEIIMIQSMFNDVSGLSDVLQGKGEAGVRAGAHADVLAKLGSARIKKRAQIIEKSLEDIGSLAVRMMKAKDDHKYTLAGGVKFAASQFTDDYQVHVDAHSASPVFVGDHLQLAMALKKLGAIDNESLLDLVKPPKIEMLKARAKKIEAQRVAMQQQAIAAGMVKGGPRKVA